mgnify:CR=1 FL=1|tara:strand:- start:414 stop:764 length:351 start_codon:yes stop_codon:yes gene_type:complete
MGFFGNLLRGGRSFFRKIGQGISGVARKVGQGAASVRKIGEGVKKIPIIGDIASPFIDTAMNIVGKVEQGADVGKKIGTAVTDASQIHDRASARRALHSGSEAISSGRNLYSQYKK